MLNKAIPILIILVFGSLTLFGFLGVNFMNHMDSPKCPMFLVGSGGCLSEGGLNLILHHVSGLQYLNQATINSNLFFVFFNLFIIASASLLALRSNYSILNVLIYFRFLKIMQNSLIKYRNSFLYWLILHKEHSRGDTNLVYVKIT